MFDVVVSLWVWLLGALAVGALTGYLVQRPPRERGIAAWLLWAGLAFGAGLLAAFLGVFTGWAGLRLESALVVFAAFIAGSAAGALARGGSLREHEGWALGLIPAGLIWWGATLFAAPDFEAELKKKVIAEIERAGGNGAGVEVTGRDVTLPKSLADVSGLASSIAHLAGVRRIATSDVVTTAGVTDTEAPRDASGDTSAAEKAPAEKGWADPGLGVPAGGGAEKSGARPGGKGREGADKTTAAEGAARRAPSAAKDAAKAGASRTGAPRTGAPSAGETAPRIGKDKASAILAALPAKGEIDAATCQAALSATVALEKIQFRSASASIRLVSAKVLDQLAALLQRCPNVKVEIGGHTDNVGADEDNDALSQRRADAVVTYLQREGVARGRLTGVGHGARQPIASNDGEDGRADNRRIEFTVK
jgi:outer membrane protein OmpA-like peptidoglycan-associated protein